MDLLCSIAIDDMFNFTTVLASSRIIPKREPGDKHSKPISFSPWILVHIYNPSASLNNSQENPVQYQLATTSEIKALHYFLLVLSEIAGIFFSILSYNPFISDHGLSTHNTTFQFLTFIFKAILAPILITNNNYNFTYWVVACLPIVLLSIRHLDLLRTFPYYQYSAMKTSLFISSTCALVSLTNLITLSYAKNYDFSPVWACYIDVAVVPVLIRYYRSYLETVFIYYLEMANNKITSETDALKKLLCLRYLVKKARIGSATEKIDLNEICFWAVLNYLSPEQLELKMYQDFNPEIKNHPNREKINFTKVTETKALLSHYGEKIIKDFLLEIIRKLHKSNKLKSVLAHLYLDHPEYILTSLYYQQAISESMGLNKIVALKLNQILVQKLHLAMHQTDGEKLTMKTLVDFEDFSTNLVTLIHSSSENYISFWEIYSKATFQLKELYQKSKVIEAEFDKIQILWNKAQENRLFVTSLYVIYTIYLSLVRSSPALAQKILSKYRSLDYDSHQEESDNLTNANWNSPHTLMLHISMAKDKLGKIIYASPNVKEILGWPHQNLLDKDFNILLPKLMQEQYTQLVMNQIEGILNARHIENLSKTIDCYIKYKNGSISPGQIHFGVHPYIQDKIVFIALLRIKQLEEDQILLGPEGYIEGYTGKIGNVLNISLEKKIHLKDICKNYSQLEESMSNRVMTSISPPKTPTSSSPITPRQFRWNREGIKTFIANQKRNKLFENIDQLPPNTVLQLISLDNGNRIREFSHEYQSHFTLKTFFNQNFYVVSLNRRSKSIVKEQKSPLRMKEEAIEFDIPEERLLSENVTCFSPTSSVNRVLLSPKITFQVKSLESAQCDTNSFMVSKAQTKENLLFSVVDSEVDHHVHHASWDGFSEENRKNIQKKAVLNLIQHENHNNDNMSVSSTYNFDTKVEEAVRMVTRKPRLGFLNILVALFVLSPIIFLSIFTAKNDKMLSFIKGNIDILSESTFLLAYIVEVGRIARFMVLSDVGLMNETKYISFGFVEDIKVSMMSALDEYSTDINTLNDMIRSSLYETEERLQKSVYQNKLPVYGLDDDNRVSVARYDNMFDLGTKIVSASRMILGTPVDQINFENQDIAFLLNNTFNDILISGEQMVSILLEDNSLKLDSRKYYLLGVMLGMGVFGGVILCVLVKVVNKFMKDRERFIDIILHISTEHTLKEVGKVRKFASIMKANDMDIKRINLKISQEYLEWKTPFKEQSAKIKKKEADSRGLNNSLIQILISISILILLLLAAYLYLLLKAQSEQNNILTKTSIMAESNFILYKLLLVRSMIFEYVQAKGTTKVRNQPINEDYNLIFSELSTSQDFFVTTLLDEKNGIGDDQDLVNVVQGDLCQIFPFQYPYIGILCNTMASGVLQKGIIGFTSYLLAVVQRVKSTFDASEKTFWDMQAAVNDADMIVLDMMEYYFDYPMFQAIDGLVKDKLKSDLVSSQNFFIDFVAVYLVVSVIFGSFAWWKMVNLLKTEMVNWRKMIRQVPYEVLTNNKLLKNYIKNNSDGVLGRAMNKL